jgi:hypothetical protein
VTARDATRNPYWPAPEWTVRCANGTWCASAKDAEHAERIVVLFDAPDAGMWGVCGPHVVHRSDPTTAVVAAVTPITTTNGS